MGPAYPTLSGAWRAAASQDLAAASGQRAREGEPARSWPHGRRSSTRGCDRPAFGSADRTRAWITLSLRWRRAGAIHTRSSGSHASVRRGGSVGLSPAGAASPSRSQQWLARSGATLRGGPGCLRRDCAPPPGIACGATRNFEGSCRSRPRAAAPDLERELRDAARAAHERARRAARGSAATYKHATDEELGYIHTNDSFGKILADARHELSERFSEARRHPIGKTVSELIDELALKLTGGGRPGADD